MLHLLYVLAFTILAFLAVGNLIRSLLTVGLESQRSRGWSAEKYPKVLGKKPHPELLDESGNVVNEPLLVMRSLSVQDVRAQLDALYQSSPSPHDDQDDHI